MALRETPSSNASPFEPISADFPTAASVATGPTGDSTDVAFEQIEIESSIPARLERVAAALANHPALIGGASYTYGELNAAANRLAHQLLTEWADNSDPVALLFSHDTPVVVAMLGVLKAGKICTVLDPLAPPERLRSIFTDLGATILVTNHEQLALVEEFLPPYAACLNLNNLLTSLPTTNPHLVIQAAAPAAITYTSGSTGTPKGVIKNHRGVLHKAWLTGVHDHTSSRDRVAMLYAANFGAAFADIWGTLLNGATIVFYDINRRGAAGLVTWILNEAISCLHIPTELYRHLLDQLSVDLVFPQMRILAPSGRIYRRDVERSWAHLPPGCVITSRFSSSETGRSMHMKLTPETPITHDIVPAGYPLDGIDLFLRTETGEPAMPGEVGQICVRSRYLPTGYWRNSELTDAIYHVDPTDPTYRICYTGDWGRLLDDGCLLFLGRKDSRVKIRGYRIDLNEIEAALYNLPAIRSAVIVVHERPNGEEYLVAYYVPADQAKTTASDIRNTLTQSLPSYMIPATFVCLDELPMTANGRVNRNLLPPPDPALRWQRPALATPYQPARTPWEERLVTTWQEVLAVEPIGIDDHFFDLGGNSLRAMQIHARVADQVAGGLPAHLLFECATVAEMALLLTQWEAMQLPESELVALLMAIEVQAM